MRSVNARAWGTFVGQPRVEFVDDPRCVRLLGSFFFWRGWRAGQGNGERWEAEEGLVFDGTSAPRCLWWFADPFTGAHRDAAVIHDAAYKRRARSRAVCDRVFYEALRASGVPRWKAVLFYWAVRIFGERW